MVQQSRGYLWDYDFIEVFRTPVKVVTVRVVFRPLSSSFAGRRCLRVQLWKRGKLVKYRPLLSRKLPGE